MAFTTVVGGFELAGTIASVVHLKEEDKIPISKKKLNYFRKNPEYAKQLKRVRELEELSHELIVTVK
ncbi:hypothetical protein C0995_010621, partial [Termitomyces sp. Mi166